jgi:hypothetical protein
MEEMPAKVQGQSVSPEQIHAFRMQRHHLLDQRTSDVVRVSADICGAQAQLMSAAEIALWARVRNLKREAIHSALWEKRTLIKTLLMRQTLHLIPAADFSFVITAIRDSRVAAVLRVMARFGITESEVETLNTAVVDALTSGPKTKRELTEQLKPTWNKKLRYWMTGAWNGFRAAIVEGLVCYGPSQGNEVTFVRTDLWLPSHKKISVADAQRLLFRRYLSAYGPASVQDFSRWSGIPMPQVKLIREQLRDELVELGPASSLLLKEDYRELKSMPPVSKTACLLPGFDSYVLGHALKDHLIEPGYYKQVYRNQGWISPVILVDGRIAGVWSHRISRGKLVVELKPFAKLSRYARDRIEEQKESLARFLGCSA